MRVTFESVFRMANKYIQKRKWWHRSFQTLYYIEFYVRHIYKCWTVFTPRFYIISVYNYTHFNQSENECHLSTITPKMYIVMQANFFDGATNAFNLLELNVWVSECAVGCGCANHHFYRIFCCWFMYYMREFANGQQKTFASVISNGIKSAFFIRFVRIIWLSLPVWHATSHAFMHSSFSCSDLKMQMSWWILALRKNWSTSIANW